MSNVWLIPSNTSTCTVIKYIRNVTRHRNGQSIKAGKQDWKGITFLFITGPANCHG